MGTIGQTLVSARSLSEYTAMFGLGAPDLEGTILDCPAGASSVAADMRRRNAGVVSVDPVYRLPAAALAALVLADVERGNRYVADHAGDYRWAYFRSVADHHDARRQAAGRFLDDFATHAGTYVPGCLPNLPFRDRAFDLVLSSHLLFTYAERLGADFHVGAIEELVRVSRNEVRVFPLVDAGGRRYPDLDGLRRRLLTAGVPSELRPVDYEFQRGTTEMLLCRRAG